MSPEKQREAMARLMGIENVNTVCWRGHQDGIEVRVPDYGNDLNAVNWAETTLLSKRDPGTFKFLLLDRYYNVELPSVVGGVPGCPAQVSALPSERLQALLRTMDVWEGEKR